MLRNTYIHIPYIGATIERRIWESGIRSWDEFLVNQGSINIPESKKKTIVSGIEDSLEHLKLKDHVFFKNTLPSREHWRAYREFKEDTAFVDIETTGLSPDYSHITIIGIYNGKETKTFIRGINLDDACDELSKYRQLVTFNGRRFDLPFIMCEFPDFKSDHIHIDIMYPLKRIGYSGGLKRIECELGLERSEDTAGLSGFDAVRLWNQYRRGDDSALDILIEYNREDIENLKKITEMTYPDLIRESMKRG